MRQDDPDIEPIRNAVHLCVDMQNIFAPGGLWQTPWMERVLPTIAAIAERSYFRRWQQATRAELDAKALDLVPALARLVPPARTIDKPAYSAFSSAELANLLIDKRVATVVITGAETDVCVLSTVLSAVDLGFRVVIVEDALCSSSDVGHDALMTMYRTRFHGQVDLVTAEELDWFWRE